MNPFAFDYPDSPLARPHPLAKLALLGSVSGCALRFGPGALAGLFLFGVVLLIVGRITVAGLWRAALPVLWLAGFAAAARGMFPGGGRWFAAETLPESGLYAARLLVVLLFARIYYASTNTAEAGDSLTLLARKLKKTAVLKRRQKAGSILADPGILVALSLRFLPLSIDTYRRTTDASLLRSAGRRARKLGLPKLATFVLYSVRSALATAQAMELRSYSPFRTIAERKFGVSSFFTLFLASVFLVLAL